MTFEEFSQEHFAGDEQKTMAHLVHESYYKDYAITGSREALQEILNTFSEERTKQFWKEMKAAVKRDSKPILKDVEPLLRVLDMRPKWTEDEEFIRKGNPYGCRSVIIGLLFLVCMAVDLVLLRMCDINAWPETVKTLIVQIGGLVVLSLLSVTIHLISNFFYFRSAEKRLKSQQNTDE